MELQTKKQTYNFNKFLASKNIPFMSNRLLVGISAKSLSQLEQDTVQFSQRLPETIDNTALRNLGIKNLRILNTRTVSGGTFERRPIEDLKVLKDAGIETIIDFRTEGSGEMAKKCSSTGLKYLNIPLDDVRERSNARYFIRTKGKATILKPEFIESLKQYFELMNNSKCYVGCHYGIDRTNMGLLLNYFFNPKYEDIPPKVIHWPDESQKNILNRNIKSIKKIFKAMTPEQKRELGIPEKYEDALREKIARLIEHNYIYGNVE